MPQRGDGFSQRRAKEILRKDGRFESLDPEDFAQMLREHDAEVLRKNQEADSPITTDDLIDFQASFETEEFVYANATGRFWNNGYWQLRIWTNLPIQGNTVEWQLGLWNGDGFSYSPRRIRNRVVKFLGDEAYVRYKTAVMSDLAPLKECLNEGCEQLGEMNKVALSYVSSPSSHRLLKTLGLRVEREWAFLFSHYTF